MTSLTEHPKKFSQKIITLVVQYWEEFLKSNCIPKNPLILYRTGLKNHLIFQEFQQLAQKFLIDLQPYKKVLQDLVYLPRLASVVIATSQNYYFTVPADFLRFYAILGREKCKELLEWLRINIQSFQTIDQFFKQLNQQLSESKVRLIKTDLAVLQELSKGSAGYFMPKYTLTDFSNLLSQAIRPSFMSVHRSLQKMNQLGILNYTVYTNYVKLGLTPYLVEHPSFSLKQSENEFIMLDVFGGTKKFVIQLVPLEQKKSIQNSHFNFIPLKYFRTFWNFTGYDSKQLDFPEILEELQFENPESFVFPRPWGISINYQDKVPVSFTKLDLEIIHWLTTGISNQTIAEYLKVREKIQSQNIQNRITLLMEEEILYPYFHTHYIGLNSMAFALFKGERNKIRLLEGLVRFMINAHCYYGKEDAQEVLFIIALMPSTWQYPFHLMIQRLRQSNFDNLQFGWCISSESRCLPLLRLWNDEEQCWISDISQKKKK